MTNLTAFVVKRRSLPTPSKVFVLDEHTIEIWDGKNTLRSNPLAVSYFYLVYDKERDLIAKGRVHGMGMDYQLAATKKAFEAIGKEYNSYQWESVAPNSNTYKMKESLISRHEFMSYFRSDKYAEEITADDAKEIFLTCLKGSSDITPELLNQLLAEYSLGFESEVVIS